LFVYNRRSLLNEKNGFAVFSVRSRERTTTTMNPATNPNQRRENRARFAEPNDNEKKINIIPPMSLAESFIRSSVASLQPGLATIIEKLGKEHIVLLSKKDVKQNILKKLEDNEDAIPRSARIDFQLSASKRTEQRPEFIALKEETSIMVNRFRVALRKQVIKSIKIELLQIEDDIREHLVKAIRLVSQSFMIIDKDKGKSADYKVYCMMEFYLGMLTVNCPMNMDEFTLLYKKTHGLEAFPPPLPADINPLENLPNVVPEDIQRLYNTIEAVFITTWSNYKSQQESNTIALELKRLSSGYFTERETAAAVSVVDLEPSADRPELQALIRKETHAENKSLRNELNNLKQQIVSWKKTGNAATKPPENVAKNSATRGQGKGASSKSKTNQPNSIQSNSNRNKNKKNNGPKKNNNNHSGGKQTDGNQAKQKHNNNNRKQNQKAGANNNATGSGKKKRKANNGNTSSMPNNNDATKRRKQSSQTSTEGQN
jgi:hypothetical protein